MGSISSPYVIIVAGGTGTRLWPLSNKKRPKQFLDLFNDGSFIQTVYKRVQNITPKEKVFIVAPAPYSAYLDQYLPDFPKENFMAEPEKKGTTAAYGYAAIFIKQLDPNATIHVLAADDYIADSQRYKQMLDTAQTLAEEKEAVVIYGAPPRSPYPGYGYVKIDKGTKTSNGVIDFYQVSGYHEKPDEAKATEYLRSGDYLWHCFGFTVKVSKLLSVIAKYDPATYEILLDVEKDLRLPARLEEFNLGRHYAKILESNIENKVLENLDQPLLVVTMESTWSDVGSWDHVYEILVNQKKDLNMKSPGMVYSIDSENNLVNNQGNPIALVGVHDLVVVVTNTATLICQRDQAQKVKQMVNLLKEKNPELL